MPTEINLKRALKLRKELEGALTQIVIPSNVNISLLVAENLVDVSPIITNAREDAKTRVEQYRKLSLILSGVRTQIASSNISNGVDAMLAEIAHIDRSISLARKLSLQEVTPPDEELCAEIALSKKALDAPSDGTRYSYGRERHVTVSITSQEVKDTALETVSELKRIRESLEDKRAVQNAKTKITVADDDADLLRKVGLI